MQNLSTLQNQLTNQGLFEAFKNQLTKDFDQSGFHTGFILLLEPEYSYIHKKLVVALEGNQKNPDAVMRLLNRIDISEVQLKKYLQEKKNETRLNVIAELIIKRVLQKVVIKQFYRGSEQS